MLAAIARTFFRLDDEQLESVRALDLLKVRAALAVYTLSLMGTAISVRRDVDYAFTLIAVSVVSALAALVLVTRRMRNVDPSLAAVEPLTRFLLLLVRSVFPPAPRDDAREAALYVAFLVTGAVYFGLQTALVLGV